MVVSTLSRIHTQARVTEHLKKSIPPEDVNKASCLSRIGNRHHCKDSEAPHLAFIDTSAA